MGEKEVIIQTRLGSPEEKKDYFIFPKDVTIIWPEGFRRRGVLEADLQAEKQKGKRVRGYQAWRAEGEIHLYLDNEHWQLSPGSRFGAPISSAKRKRI